MSKFEIVMPKMGESIIEATITKWLKNEGDVVSIDDPVVEIATDKVDSEIPSPVEGILIKKKYKEGDVVPVGMVIAILEMGDQDSAEMQNIAYQPNESVQPSAETQDFASQRKISVPDSEKTQNIASPLNDRFYSPLVKNIAKQENISIKELENITGTGKDSRVTKNDIFQFLDSRKRNSKQVESQANVISFSGEDQIIEMDRIRQLIANHMVKSVQTSPHVTSFMEADMTKIVQWREKMKGTFLEKENEKLTFTPIFLNAIAKSVRDFPLINVSVDGTRIIVHKNINIGMAVALPNFSLIVPVIKNADQKSLLGIVKNVNDIANRARINKLLPDEIAGGTISLTNLGSFGTLMGTPIINQPQTAIVAVGSIKKRPVVIESPDGDSIAIRQIMYVSVTYDHRVIDGALGGQFLSRLVQYLENFNSNQTI